MKTLSSTILTVILASTSFGCSKGLSHKGDASGEAGATQTPTSGTGSQDLIVSYKYFRGGWYGISPNWSHDMTIDFLNFKDNKYRITAKLADPFCIKAGGITMTETTQLLQLYSSLLLMTSTGPQTADFGVEYVELKTSTGIVRRYYLDNHEVPAGAQYASNPNELSTFLKELHSKLNEQICQ
jgi:hypothetical protein